MWYVVQTFTGQEEAARKAIEQAVEAEDRTSVAVGADSMRAKPILEKCFVPQYRIMRKKDGELRAVVEPMFPGYLIVVTNRVDDLASCLRRRLHHTRVIGGRSKAFIPLSKDEVAWIDAFTCGGSDAVEISTGVVSQGDTVEVIAGPLVGHEGWIREINHRRKVAYLEMTAFGRTIQAEVGLRVMRKR